MNNPPYLQYHSNNLDYAIQNRKNMTRSESKVWYDYLRKRPLWNKFIRQKLLWPYIVDFYCSKLQLVIEIDWNYHEAKVYEDWLRTDYINDMWIKVIRYLNHEVLNRFEETCKDINKNIAERKSHIEEENSFLDSWLVNDSLPDKRGGGFATLTQFLW